MILLLRVMSEFHHVTIHKSSIELMVFSCLRAPHIQRHEANVAEKSEELKILPNQLGKARLFRKNVADIG